MFPDNWGDHCHETDNIDRARVHFAYLGYFFGVINTHRNFYVLNIVVFARKVMQYTSKFESFNLGNQASVWKCDTYKGERA